MGKFLFSAQRIYFFLPLIPFLFFVTRSETLFLDHLLKLVSPSFLTRAYRGFYDDIFVCVNLAGSVGWKFACEIARP